MTWGHRSATLACGCQFCPPLWMNPGDEWTCELHGPTTIERIGEVNEK